MSGRNTDIVCCGDRHHVGPRGHKQLKYHTLLEHAVHQSQREEADTPRIFGVHNGDCLIRSSWTEM